MYNESGLLVIEKNDEYPCFLTQSGTIYLVNQNSNGQSRKKVDHENRFNRV